jgi:hypothetical protein
MLRKLPAAIYFPNIAPTFNYFWSLLLGTTQRILGYLDSNQYKSGIYQMVVYQYMPHPRAPDYASGLSALSNNSLWNKLRSLQVLGS